MKNTLFAFSNYLLGFLQLSEFRENYEKGNKSVHLSRLVIERGVFSRGNLSLN